MTRAKQSAKPLVSNKVGGRRGAASALLILLLTTGATALFAFGFQVLLARSMSAEEYGTIATALATVSLLGPLAGLGVSKFWLRAYGIEGWRARRWISSSLQLIGASTLVATALAYAWIVFEGDDTLRRVSLILLPTLLVYVTSELAFARFQLEENYRKLGLYEMLPNGVRMLVAIGVFAFGLNLFQTAWLLAVSLGTLGVILIFPTLGLARGRMNLVGHGEAVSTETGQPVGVWDVLRETWPFALAGVFYLIYFQSDIILLGRLAGAESAGIYNVAFTIIAAAFLLPSILHQKYLLPKIHRWAVHDRDRLLEVFRFGNAITLLLGILVAVGLWVLSPLLISLLFGERYQSAADVLRILAVAVPGRYLATSVGAVLVTGPNMRRKVWLMGATAILNIVGNLALIPIMGPIGAAWATVISESVLVLLYLFAVRMYVFGPSALTGWTLRIPD